MDENPRHTKRNHRIPSFRNWNVRAKILSAFVIAALIPILLVQILSYQVNRMNLANKLEELMVNNLMQTAKQVNLTVEIYANLVYQLRTDEQVIQSVNQLVESGSAQAAAYNSINQRLQQYHNSAPGIRSLSIICPDGSSVVYDTKTDSAIENVWGDFDELQTIKPFVDSIKTNDLVVTPTTRLGNPASEIRLFHLSRTIFDLNDIGKGPIAVLVLSVEESVLGNICNTPSSTNEERSSINFILDDERNVISYPNSFYSGVAINPRYTIEEYVGLSGFLQNKEQGVITYRDETTGWTYYNVYDVDYVYRELNMQQSLYVVVGAVALMLSTLLILYTSNYITRSIKMVKQGIQQVQAGNLDIQVPVTSKDEIGKIANAFNEMTGKVKQSLADVADAKEREKVAELRALEAQINPHFIYNTLDTINWMAIERENHDISRALRDFGVILRYSVSKSETPVSLWEVADWIEKYVSLHLLRFGNLFTFQMNVDPSVRNIKMHKLLLQPFVENSILHGFSDIESGGLLRIDFTRSEDENNLVIIVEDNGRGMSPELARQFNEMETGSVENGGIGIANVFARIRIYYGAKAYWNISSISGMGTIVTLVLPIEGM